MPPILLEILGWIGHLYHTAAFLEQKAVGLSDVGEEGHLPEVAAKVYAMMPRLLQAVSQVHIEAGAYTRIQRQRRIAARKVEERAQREKSAAAVPRQPILFDDVREEG